MTTFKFGGQRVHVDEVRGVRPSENCVALTVEDEYGVIGRVVLTPERARKVAASLSHQAAIVDGTRKRPKPDDIGPRDW